jgi:NIPSNAP
MIVVRNVFQIDPGQMKQAKEEIQRNRELSARLGFRITRVLTDLVGTYYTLVLESEFSGLAEYEAAMQKLLADPGWQQSYGRMRGMIRGGHREIYTVVV